MYSMPIWPAQSCDFKKWKVLYEKKLHISVQQHFLRCLLYTFINYPKLKKQPKSQILRCPPQDFDCKYLFLDDDGHKIHLFLGRVIWRVPPIGL